MLASPQARRSLAGDESGATAVVIGLVATAFLGFVGLGSEIGLWYTTQRTMQGAADGAAYSSAMAYAAGATCVTTSAATQGCVVAAKTVVAKYGFIDGQSGDSVIVNRPPASGNYTSDATAVEVIVQHPENMLLSSLFLGSRPTFSARAVATPGSGDNCVLALDKTVSGAISAGGTTNVNLVKCGISDDSDSASAFSVGGGASVTADSASIVGGLSTSNNGTLTTVSNPTPVTGAPPIADPYADVDVPSYSGCDVNNMPPVHGTVTIDANGGIKVLCSGVTVNAGGTLTLQNGIFILDQGSLSVAGGATLNLVNATLILTNDSGNANKWGTISISGGATVNATAPTSGTTSGLAFFVDRNAPAATEQFNGGSSQNITGAIYAPSATISYTGGVATGSGCTQIVGDQVVFTGNSAVESNCTGKGTRNIARKTALVE